MSPIHSLGWDFKSHLPCQDLFVESSLRSKDGVVSVDSPVLQLGAHVQRPVIGDEAVCVDAHYSVLSLEMELRDRSSRRASGGALRRPAPRAGPGPEPWWRKVVLQSSRLVGMNDVAGASNGRCTESQLDVAVEERRIPQEGAGNDD